MQDYFVLSGNAYGYPKNMSVYNWKVIILKIIWATTQKLSFVAPTELENITITQYPVTQHNAPTGFDNIVRVS